MAATSLHPHFKKQYLVKNFPEMNWQSIENTLVLKLATNVNQDDQSTESPSKKIKITSSFYDSDDEDCTENSSINDLSILLKKYMNYPVSESPHDLSQLQATEFSPIKHLFIDLNTKLPSSSSCERLFSIAKLSYSNLRGKLDDDKIDELIVLSANGNQDEYFVKL